MDIVFIEDLRIETVIGIYDWERKIKQPVVLDIEMASDIRKAAAIGQPGPNQLKSYTRAGMGPCQGRQCGYTVAHILAQEQGRTVAEVGFYRIRPPLKPVTLAELATLNIDEQ